MPGWKASKLTNDRLTFSCPILPVTGINFTSHLLTANLSLRKTDAKRAFPVDFPVQDRSWVYISLHLPVSCPTMQPSLLITHQCPPPGTPIPPPLPFASLQTLPYSSRVVKRWSNNSHVTLFALSWFGNHHWPACEEVWESLPCCLEVSLQGRVALVVPAAGTASRKDGMGRIPYSSYFTMSRNLGTPNVSKLQLFFSLRIIIQISDKFAPILRILKQI